MSVDGYVVITPARNEAQNIGRTIASMARQTRRPDAWVIVDDGSSDGTESVIDAAAREYDWIHALHRPDRGHRHQGTGVIETFNDGLRSMNGRSWQWLVKFDADLSFDPDYFSRCLAKFDSDPSLGIGGGMICRTEGNRLVCESPGDPIFHVRGATKIYRRECWDAIGGLICAPGWDTIDELKANMLGWRTYSFPDVPIRHHRPTGRADGAWRTQVKFGLSNYIAGYHPLFMAAKCMKRLLQRPFLVGALGLWWGFCRGYVTGTPPVGDPKLIRYVRQQQLNKLMFRPSLW